MDAQAIKTMIMRCFIDNLSLVVLRRAEGGADEDKLSSQPSSCCVLLNGNSIR